MEFRRSGYFSEILFWFVEKYCTNIIGSLVCLKISQNNIVQFFWFIGILVYLIREYCSGIRTGILVCSCWNLADLGIFMEYCSGYMGGVVLALLDGGDWSG